MTDTLEHLATEADDGERADVVLGRHFAELSRRVARRLALAGHLRIDGKRAPPSQKVRAGHRLTLRLPDAVDTTRGSAPLDVLRENDDYLYVSKPAGIHTVAHSPDQTGCLSVMVAAHHPACRAASEDPREAGALHRLDRDTSGVVCFAKHREAWDSGRRAFRENSAEKIYLAVAPRSEPASWPPPLPEGAFAEWLRPCDAEEDRFTPLLAPRARLEAPPPVQTFEIRAALGPDSDRRRAAVRLDGRRATTVVRPLAVGPSTGEGVRPWLLQLRLRTGSRHQARVHLAWVGMSLEGDRLYGSADDPHPLALHALRLDLSVAIPTESPVIAPAPDAFVDRFFR